VGAEEVADGEVAVLVVASGLADVDVERAGPLRRPGEEVVVGGFRRGREQVPETLQRFDIPLSGLERVHGDLEVDDGLGRQAGDGRGAHMLDPRGEFAEGGPDAVELRIGQAGPGRVVLDDPDRRVEAVVQRGVSLHPRARYARETRTARRVPGRSRDSGRNGGG
jgi:hypothetical protein